MATQKELIGMYGSEDAFGQRLKEAMKARGWSQSKLAEEMRAVGHTLHQSAISKIISGTSTSDGRRSVTLDEAMGFARALDVDLTELLLPKDRLEELADSASLEGAWRDLISAERLRTGVDYLQRIYSETLQPVKDAASENPTLRRQIEDRYAKHREMAERRARAMAERDGLDISTPEKFEAYLWGMWADSAMLTAADVLGIDHSGK